MPRAGHDGSVPDPARLSLALLPQELESVDGGPPFAVTEVDSVEGQTVLTFRHAAPPKAGEYVLNGAVDEEGTWHAGVGGASSDEGAIRTGVWIITPAVPSAAAAVDLHLAWESVRQGTRLFSRVLTFRDDDRPTADP